MSTTKCHWFAIVLAAMVLRIATASAAQVVVLASTVPGLNPGALVDSATAIKVPAGGMVMINELSGKTRTIAGPYDGPIAGPAPTAQNQDLASSLGRLVASRHAEQSRLGAVRSAPDQRLQDPELVTVAYSSTQCIRSGAPVRLWRPSTMDADSAVIITDAATSTTIRTVWHKGLTALNWPDELPIGSGGRYLVNLEFSPRPVELVLHRLPDGLTVPAEQAAWMESAGCRRQALLLLERIVAAGG